MGESTKIKSVKQRIAIIALLVLVINCVIILIILSLQETPQVEPEDTFPQKVKSPSPEYKSPQISNVPLRELPAGVPDIVCLLPDDSERLDVVTIELARQAMWLAAHEELGLYIFDAELGEAAPAALPTDRKLRVRSFVQSSKARLGSFTAGDNLIWQGVEIIDLSPISQSFTRALASAERLSRTLFVDCLKAARFVPSNHSAGSGTVPEEVTARLESMRAIDQFAAVQGLHATIRRDGESPELLGALVRAYANLGLLVNHHWDRTSCVYLCRALLYAQRLASRQQNSAYALWHRAYAAALIGRHDVALADLEAAGTRETPPQWVELIDAYVHFDTERLDAINARARSPLGELLKFLASTTPESGPAHLAAGKKFLAANPECMRVHGDMLERQSLGQILRASNAGLAAHDVTIRTSVAKLPGLPDTVKKLNFSDNDERTIYEALYSASFDRSVRSMPSWSALAHLLEGERFLISYYQLHEIGDLRAMSAADEAQDVLDALLHYPLRSLVETFIVDPVQEPDRYRNLFSAAKFEELDIRANIALTRYALTKNGVTEIWYGRALSTPKILYPELLRDVYSASDERGYRARWGKELFAISPHSPLAVALQVSSRKPDTAEKLGLWERSYANNAVVQEAIARRHLEERRFDDAIRCAQRWTELSPIRAAFSLLARAYLDRGDEDAFVRTHEAFLRIQVPGLEHMSARVDIAKHYMKKGNFSKAEPYAVKAAESYANAGLLSAARCKSGLKKWVEAIDYYRAAADRYDFPAIDWFLATRRFPELDSDAAQRAVDHLFVKYPTGLPSHKIFDESVYRLAVGDWTKALKLLVASNSTDPQVFSVLMAALLAEQHGQVKTRDQELARFFKSNSDTDHKTFATIVKGWLIDPATDTSEKFRTDMIRLSDDYRIDADFFAGWLASIRGDNKRAQEHWKRCRDAFGGTAFLKFLAQSFIDKPPVLQK